MSAPTKLPPTCPQDCLTSRWIFFRERGRNCLETLQWNFRRDFFSEEMHFHSLNLELFLLAFFRKTWAVLSKPVSTCPEKQFGEEKCFERPITFWPSSYLQKEVFDFMTEYIQQSIQNYFLRVNWNTSRHFSWNNLHFLPFSDFQSIFSEILTKKF